MFHKLKIKNFQSHKDTELEFSEGVNVIIGPSDSGKSAIFRAVKWLIHNRPLGNSFCSFWADNATSVEVQFDDVTVLRARDKNKQIYKLNDLEFTAFKTEVPEEIVTAMNIEEVNFQQQFDRPFLLDISPGEVAQYFNKIAHLDNIDKSLKNLKQYERKAKQNLDRYNEDKLEVETELEKYKDLETLDEALQQIEAEHVVFQNEEKHFSLFVETLNSLVEVQEEIQQYGLMDELLKQIDSITAIWNTTIGVQSIVKELSNVQTSISELLLVDKAISFVEEITNLMYERERLVKDRNGLQSEVTQVQNLIESISVKEAEVKDLTNKFKKAFPDVCPLCGRS